MPERDSRTPPVQVAATLRADPALAGGTQVTASGHNALAQRILALAEEAGVPHYQDPHLARLLAQADLGEQVPPALYQAVAEVIAFVWSLDDPEDATTPIP